MENKMFHHIKVTAPENDRKRETVELDGKPIRCVSLDYHYDVDSAPCAKIEVSGTENLDIHESGIVLDISPENLQDAVLIVLDELLKHSDLYNGFLASIMSVLNEKWNGETNEQIAEKILKRITGEE